MASLDMGSTISQDIIGRTFGLYMSQPWHGIIYILGHNGEDIQPQHISASTFFKLRNNSSQPRHSASTLLKFQKNPFQPRHPASTFLKFEKHTFQPRHSLYIHNFNKNPFQPQHSLYSVKFSNNPFPASTPSPYTASTYLNSIETFPSPYTQPLHS